MWRVFRIWRSKSIPTTESYDTVLIHINIDKLYRCTQFLAKKVKYAHIKFIYFFAVQGAKCYIHMISGIYNMKYKIKYFKVNKCHETYL